MTTSTATIIRRHSGFANVPDTFGIVAPGYEDAADDADETVCTYPLPHGYEVAKTAYGEDAIFGPDGHCNIVMHLSSGRPQLVSANPARAPILYPASKTSPDLLRDTGEALYGPRWQTDLGRDLDISDRSVRRIISGAQHASPGLYRDLLRIAKERALALDAIIDRLQEAVEPDEGA